MSISPPLPNFERADYEGAPPQPDRCAYCQRGIATEYYRVDGNLACSSCAQQAQSLIPPDSHKAYSRAVLFGIGAAIVGCIGYALVFIITGWTIGYAAIGVGYLIGKAMKAGSHGLGGRRYQITAAILTYAAVTMSFLPLALYQLNQQGGLKAGISIQTMALISGWGLISPFRQLEYSLGGGLLGIFIIFVGMSAAWRLTQRVGFAVDGPFQNTPSLR